MRIVLTTLLLLIASRKVKCRDYDWRKYLLTSQSYLTNQLLILEIMERIIANNHIPAHNITISRSGLQDQFLNPNSFYIYHNAEHNVVLPGFRNVKLQREDTIKDGVFQSYDKKKNYHVFVKRFFQVVDVVIDYSMLNIYNIITSNKFSENTINKLVYVPPMPYAYEPNYGNHSLSVMTSFIAIGDKHSDRRANLLDWLKEAGLDARNQKFDNLETMKNQLDDAKILVNVHQTFHWHTMEEYRVLPALLRGVVVVCEWVPMAHLLPFYDYILFAPYDDIVPTVLKVEKNYEYYRNKFFGPKSKLPKILSYLKEKAYDDLEARIVHGFSGRNGSIVHDGIDYGFTFKRKDSATVYLLLRNYSVCHFEDIDTYWAFGYAAGDEFEFDNSIPLLLVNFPHVGRCWKNDINT